MIKIKRVYEKQSRDDGFRVLVDRLWPRGIKKTNLHFNQWPKEIAPSPELRKYFGHEASKFSKFKKDYKKELINDAAITEIDYLAKVSLKRNLTLLYGAYDEKINHAVILKELIERAAKSL